MEQKVRLDRTVYDTIGKLKRESIKLRNVASSDEVNFEESMELRKQQSEKYKKWQFYQNVVSAVSKQGGA